MKHFSFFRFLALIGAAGLLLTGGCQKTDMLSAPGSWRQTLLEQARRTASETLTKPLATTKEAADPGAAWSAEISLYHNGMVVAQRGGHGSDRGKAVGSAAQKLVSQTDRPITSKELAEGRLFITVSGPGREDSLVEHQGKAYEITGDVTAVRKLTPDLIRHFIGEQKEYLLRQIDPTHYAFFKLYDARADVPEDRLRTIYTASGLWTLLKMNDFLKDPRIGALIGPMADYLLSMQVSDGEWKGAFYYSFYPKTNEKQPRFVVGTASKTIFTLLELHRRTGESRYLDAARAAGLWLVKQTAPDGRVFPVVIWHPREQRWVQPKKQSILYSCQTLTALSRLSAVTHDPAYKEAADRIAGRMLAHAQESNFFVGDDFRPPNTVSTSWLSMAFLDYSKITSDERYTEAIFSAGRRLLDTQIRDASNILDFGRYSDTWASSGNGWMNEVLVEIQKRCLSEKRDDCADYENALRYSTRWLIQNIYTPENSYLIPNPDRARGGSIRDSKEESVRTDAVCHGGNSLIGVLDLLGAKAALSVPEKS